MIASIFSLLQEIPLTDSQVKNVFYLKETCNIYSFYLQYCIYSTHLQCDGMTAQ